MPGFLLLAVLGAGVDEDPAVRARTWTTHLRGICPLTSVAAEPGVRIAGGCRAVLFQGPEFEGFLQALDSGKKGRRP